MASVTVGINGKKYRMACEEGQEAHLEGLAEQLDSYVNHLKGSFGDIGDQRLTVMAGILLADELNEARESLKKRENELAASKKQNASVSDNLEKDHDALAQGVEDVAKRIEELASKLAAVEKK